jgi:hypothetical protein
MQPGQGVSWSPCHGRLALLACALPHDSLLVHSFQGDRSENVTDTTTAGWLVASGSQPAGTRWVHAEPAVGECSGHERSQPVARNRRSGHRASHNRATGQEAGQSSRLPTRLPRALRALAHEAAVVTEGRPSPYGHGGANGATGVPCVILDSRATSVLFTGVLNGPQRTTTKQPRPAPFPMPAG